MVLVTLATWTVRGLRTIAPLSRGKSRAVKAAPGGILATNCRQNRSELLCWKRIASKNGPELRPREGGRDRVRRRHREGHRNLDVHQGFHREDAALARSRSKASAEWGRCGRAALPG